MWGGRGAKGVDIFNSGYPPGVKFKGSEILGRKIKGSEILAIFLKGCEKFIK